MQVRKLSTPDAFLAHCARLGVDLPFETQSTDDPLGRSLRLAAPAATLANRFAVLPMEGWDGTDDGRPTDLVRRRWRRFGSSGAALIWGGEAVAVRADGRANPHQLVIGDHVAELRGELLEAHAEQHPGQPAPVVGLQLTHSGRFSHARALTAHAHPWLDARRSGRVLTDDELDALAADFVDAARVAHAAGFDFVDVKHCHGYLAHELLGAVDRPGRYGGELEHRTRFLHAVIDGIRRDVPSLAVGVRLSLFDVVPHRAGADGRGEPEPVPVRTKDPYPYGFGGDGTGVGVDLTEPIAVVHSLVAAGVTLVCATAGSPYYCPHVQRPAFFPPSDGYQPPHDPLLDVDRLLRVTAQLKAAVPTAVIVGTGYSYLQEWLPAVARGVIADGGADLVGVGRMVLSYPEFPADVLAGRPLDRTRLCRTFSDCTTAPRHGLVSGCYPLDELYATRPERSVLLQAKRELAGARRRSQVEP